MVWKRSGTPATTHERHRGPLRSLSEKSSFMAVGERRRPPPVASARLGPARLARASGLHAASTAQLVGSAGAAALMDESCLAAGSGLGLGLGLGWDWGWAGTRWAAGAGAMIRPTTKTERPRTKGQGGIEAKSSTIRISRGPDVLACVMQQLVTSRPRLAKMSNVIRSVAR